MSKTWRLIQHHSGRTTVKGFQSRKESWGRGRDEHRKEGMTLLPWDTKHALGDACSISCTLSTESHSSYRSLHITWTRQTDFYRRKETEQFENTDPKGSREWVNTLNSLFPPSAACLRSIWRWMWSSPWFGAVPCEHPYLLSCIQARQLTFLVPRGFSGGWGDTSTPNFT